MESLGEIDLGPLFILGSLSCFHFGTVEHRQKGTIQSKKLFLLASCEPSRALPFKPEILRSHLARFSISPSPRKAMQSQGYPRNNELIKLNKKQRSHGNKERKKKQVWESIFRGAVIQLVQT